MIRIAENLLIGGDFGNTPPVVAYVEINEQHYDSIVGPFYRVKGRYARTDGIGYSQPIEVGAPISFGLLVKGTQPHVISAILHTETKEILSANDIEITTDWQWIFREGVTRNEVREEDKIRLYVYARDFELHWAKSAAYIGPPSDIWTPAHADLTPEQASLMKYGEFKEAQQI